MKKAKHQTKSKNKKYIFILILIIISILAFTYYKFHTNKNKNILNDIKIDETQITETKTERMLQLEELKKQNNDIVAWLEIPDTKINFPVLQTTDNEYYMTHTYKRIFKRWLNILRQRL